MITSTLALSRRAVVNALRRPQFIAPLVMFPTLFLAVNVGGLNRTAGLEGFPEVEGFLDFQLAAAMTQSLLLGGVAAGIAMALEIEGGFFDRLVAAPIPRTAIVLGRVLAAGVLAVGQVLYFTILGLAFGASIKGGLIGLVLIVAMGMLAGMGFGAIGTTLALRARSAATVQGIFPLVFVILFVSTAFFPENLLSSPSDVVAAYNPLSYIADGLRDPIISTTSAGPVLEGFAAAAAIAAAGITLSVLALRGRLRDA